MKGLAKIFVLLLVVAASACSSDTKRLARIDAAMDADPAGALAQLANFDTDRLNSADLAYYTLLLTDARYKNYEPVAPDSLFNAAYDHFRSASDDKYIRIRFLKAVMDYDSREYVAAIREALPAYERARAERNDYWTAKCAQLIADIYFDVFNYGQSEKYVSIAAKAYHRAGRESHHRYALTDLAAVRLNLGKESEALALLDSLEAAVRADNEPDSALLECIAANRLSAQLTLNEPAEADGSAATLGTALDQSEALRASGRLAEADSLLSLAATMAASPEDSVRVQYAQYLQLMAEDRYREAAAVADSVMALQSEIAERMLKESVVAAQSDYYRAESDAQLSRAKVYRVIMWVALAILLIIIVLVVIIYRTRIRAQAAELEASIAAVAAYRNLAEKSEQEAGRKDALLEELFRQKWSTINMLCNEYFERGDSDAARRAIVLNIESELSKLTSKGNLLKIEQAVDRYMGGTMTLLRAECAWLKEDDFAFIALVFAGLSARAVCMFAGIKYKYYYLKKSRLLKRLAESDASHRDLFVARLKG